MKWIISVKDDKSKRISINYNPIDEILIFIGQCKLSNAGWTDFTSHFIPTEDIGLKKIQDMLVSTHNKLIERFDIYTNLNNGLSIIGEVDFSMNET